MTNPLRNLRVGDTTQKDKQPQLQDLRKRAIRLGFTPFRGYISKAMEDRLREFIDSGSPLNFAGGRNVVRRAISEYSDAFGSDNKDEDFEVDGRNNQQLSNQIQRLVRTYGPLQSSVGRVRMLMERFRPEEPPTVYQLRAVFRARRGDGRTFLLGTKRKIIKAVSEKHLEALKNNWINVIGTEDYDGLTLEPIEEVDVIEQGEMEFEDPMEMLMRDDKPLDIDLFLNGRLIDVPTKGGSEIGCVYDVLLEKYGKQLYNALFPKQKRGVLNKEDFDELVKRLRDDVFGLPNSYIPNRYDDVRFRGGKKMERNTTCGLSSTMLCKVLRVLRINAYGFDWDGTLVFRYIYEEDDERDDTGATTKKVSKQLKPLIFVVASNHMYVVESQQGRDFLVRRAQSITKATTPDGEDSVEGEESGEGGGEDNPEVVNLKRFFSTFKKTNKKKECCEKTEVITLVGFEDQVSVETEDQQNWYEGQHEDRITSILLSKKGQVFIDVKPSMMEEIWEILVRKTGKLLRIGSDNGGYINRIIINNDLVIHNNPDLEVVVHTQEKLGVEMDYSMSQSGVIFKWKGFTAMKKDYHSRMSPEMKRALGNWCVRAPEYKNGTSHDISKGVVATDINKLYSAVVLEPMEKWRVFDGFEDVEVYTGSSRLEGDCLYYLEFDYKFNQNFNVLVDGNGWYYSSVVKLCQAYEFPFVIKYFIRCAKTLSTKYFEFLRPLYDLVEPKYAKSMINRMVGVWNRTDVVESRIDLVVDANALAKRILKVGGCDKVFVGDTKIKGAKFVYSENTKSRGSSGKYLYLQVLQEARIRVLKMLGLRGCLYNRMRNCWEGLIQVKTDSVICKQWLGEIKLSDEIGGYKVEVATELMKKVKRRGYSYTRESYDWDVIGDMRLVKGDVENTTRVAKMLVEKYYGGYIAGAAGCGKSSLLREMRRLYAGKKVFVGAPSNKASRNINGKTLHSIFGLGVGDTELEQGVISKTTQVLIVDEISMVPKFMWSFIIALKNNGCIVWLMGDVERQLRPVASQAIDYNSQTFKWLCDYTKLELMDCLRSDDRTFQLGMDVWRDRVRWNEMNVLNKQYDLNIYLCYDNRKREQVNQAIMRRRRGDTYIRLPDVKGIRGRVRYEGFGCITPLVENKYYFASYLYVGLPVMSLANNKHYEVMNGDCFVVEDFCISLGLKESIRKRWEPMDEKEAVEEVERWFEEEGSGVKALDMKDLRKKEAEVKKLSRGRPDCVRALEKVRVGCENTVFLRADYDNELRIEMDLTTFVALMSPSYCMTIHKSQGATFDEPYGVLQLGKSKSEMDDDTWKRLTYVALTRSTTYENIHIEEEMRPTPEGNGRLSATPLVANIEGKKKPVIRRKET